MSSTSGIAWALDRAAELAGRSGDQDPALEVVLVLVGALDPPPEAAVLEPAARRIGKLRLAQALDQPGDLRLGAARLLAALDASSPATAASFSVAPAASSEPAPETPPDAPPEAPGRRSSRTSDRRVILSFPTPGPAVKAAPGAVGAAAPAARRNGEYEPGSPQAGRTPGTINGPHTATLGSTLTLSGTAPPGNGRVTLEGSYDDGRTWQTLSTVESAHGRYATKIALHRRGQLQMRIVFADGSTAAGSILVR